MIQYHLPLWHSQRLHLPAMLVLFASVFAFSATLTFATTVRQIQVINSGNGSYSTPNSMNSILFFNADDGTSGRELWKSDGTTPGTVMVKDIAPGSFGSSPFLLTNMNGMLFFVSNGIDNNSTLWKSDGTADGTILVKDMGVSNLASLTNMNGMLFFVSNGINNNSTLWKSDGTADGTILVKDMGASNLASLTNVNGMLFFVSNGINNNSTLWKSDGTADGTILVKDMGASNLASLTNVNGTLFFFEVSNSVIGKELWKSDGTANGTALVRSFEAVQYPAIDPITLINVNSTIFFNADDGINGRELWKSDGTIAGTVLVKDINPGMDSSDPIPLANVNGILFFEVSNSTIGRGLWRSDGTAAGTVLVKIIDLGGPSYPQSRPMALMNVNGTLFFVAYNSSMNSVVTELWKSDGTAAGTVLVKTINLSVWTPYGYLPIELMNVKGALFFRATDDNSGTELWKSDGTAAGTILVKDIYPGHYSSSPADFATQGPWVYLPFVIR